MSQSIPLNDTGTGLCHKMFSLLLSNVEVLGVLKISIKSQENTSAGVIFKACNCIKKTPTQLFFENFVEL